MSARAVAALVALVACAAPASAQHGDLDSAGIPDVPGGPGRITGVVENPDAPERVAGIELLLYALPSGGAPGLRRAQSDAAGRFAFEGVSNDPSTAYLIGARYAGIPYPGDRVAFAEGETEKSVRVRVGEPSADASTVSVVESQLEVAWSGGRLAIAELVRFENRGERTAYVPAEARAAGQPLYRATLPDGADDFQIPLGIQPEGLVREGTELRFYGPLYPSSWPGPLSRDQGLAFHYTLPGSAGPVTIEKRFPTAAQRVVVVVPATGPSVSVEGAREEGPPPAENAGAELPARRLVVDGVPSGGSIEIRVAVPESRVDPDALRLLESRLFLELDDAALQVQEEHVLEVRGEMPIVAPDRAPLLAIPVPPGATDVRFSRDAFALGLAPDDGAGAVLHGPLPPGETRVQISYHLPAGADGTTVFEKRFGRHLPLLNVYVADTGLRAESERLHRRRPVKTADRAYVALEAFEVEPSETVKLALTPLAAPLQPPRAALVGAVAIAAGIAFAFLLAPLRPDRGAGGAPPDEIGDARSEREAVYAALRDLEHDRETGKLAEEDYASMRSALRARAAALLRAETANAPSEAPPSRAETPSCPSCGAAARADDRFCAACGTRLVAAEESRA